MKNQTQKNKPNIWKMATQALIVLLFFSTIGFGAIWSQLMIEQNKEIKKLSDKIEFMNLQPAIQIHKHDITGVEINRYYQKLKYSKYTIGLLNLFHDHYTEIGNYSRPRALLKIKYALWFDVPVNIVFSVARHESGFDPFAVATNRNLFGVTYDFGEFQLNSGSFGQYTKAQLMEPELNTFEAVKYMRIMFDRYGSWMLAIMAYNGGNLEMMSPETWFKVINYYNTINNTVKELDKKFNGLFG